LLLITVAGPLLVPIRPVGSGATPESLADPDSLFADINGLQVHYKASGQGEPALLLLHGFLSSTYSWRDVQRPLSEYGAAVAFDRPAFGLTSRPEVATWRGPNPYSLMAQSSLTVGLMDHLGLETAVLVGHSAGGPVALHTALEYPERVAGLVLVDPAVYMENRVPGWLGWLLRTPQMERIGPVLMRSVQRWGLELGRTAWYRPRGLTPEVLQGYVRPLELPEWDRALWEFMLAYQPAGLDGRLGEITQPALVVSGEKDVVVPVSDSARVARALPQAQFLVLPECGHVPQEECPHKFLAAVRPFLVSLLNPQE
jgi:pimeloyl-ACP methyl ester carboxylesterase